MYVGFDDPKSLGKKETGSRTAMPVFKSFIKEIINIAEETILQFEIDIEEMAKHYGQR